MHAQITKTADAPRRRQFEFLDDYDLSPPATR